MKRYTMKGFGMVVIMNHPIINKILLINNKSHCKDPALLTVPKMFPNLFHEGGGFKPWQQMKKTSSGTFAFLIQEKLRVYILEDEAVRCL